MILVFPGSFDPITQGHADLIRRALPLADRLYVALLHNPRKNYMFTLEQRTALIRACFPGEDKIVVESHQGLLIDYVRRKGADAVIRGLRSFQDFGYEYDMAQANRNLGGCETLFLPARGEYSHLSSSTLREVLSFGGDISGMIPEEGLALIRSWQTEKTASGEER